MTIEESVKRKILDEANGVCQNSIESRISEYGEYFWPGGHKRM